MAMFNSVLYVYQRVHMLQWSYYLSVYHGSHFRHITGVDDGKVSTVSLFTGDTMCRNIMKYLSFWQTNN